MSSDDHAESSGGTKAPVWRTLPKFLLVGAANTALGAAIMFLLYNLAGTGYWLSTAISYVVGSVFSFFANRSFTFSHKGSMLASAWRFVAVIAVCYGVSFGIARPLTRLVLTHVGVSQVVIDNAAMVLGMIVFTGLNYIGQRAFVFNSVILPKAGPRRQAPPAQ